MTRWLREFRLIPMVLIATGCLFALKAIGIMFDGGYTLGQRLARSDTLVVTTVPIAPTTVLRSEAVPLEVAQAEPRPARQSWMQEMFNYPDVTGSVNAPPKESKDAKGSKDAKETGPKNAPPKIEPAPESKALAGTSIPIDAPKQVSGAERAILERLHERRQELDSRARELDLRETMLKEAEKKLETRMEEMKAGEVRAKSGGLQREEAELARFKGLVTMYETMKPKDAAKIFDRLDIRILLEVASQINPRRMSEILAQMSAESAERLTVELAARSGSDKTPNPAELPKIDGKPGGG